MSAITKPWYQLKCSKNELQLLGTLNGGQSFRYRYSDHFYEFFNSKFNVGGKKDLTKVG